MKNMQRVAEKRLAGWLSVLLTICTCLSLMLTAFAAGPGSIQIVQTDTLGQTPVSGVRLTLYRVAEPSAESASGFAFVDEYASLGLDANALGEPEVFEQALQKLDALVDAQKPEGVATQVTDAEGKVSFNGLEDGIYLVKQTNTAEDFASLGYTYETESYLVSLPRTGEDGTLTRTVVCQPKGRLVTEDNTELIVYKVWKDDNNKYGKRPEEITVGLYLGETLKEQVVLSAVNNWRYQWDNLEPEGDWSVKEITAVENYSATVTREGTAITITNTYTPPDTPNTPKTPGTPKTGDETKLILWSGVAAVGAGGILLALFSGKRKKDAGQQD